MTANVLAAIANIKLHSHSSPGDMVWLSGLLTTTRFTNGFTKSWLDRKLMGIGATAPQSHITELVSIALPIDSEADDDSNFR
jgi:hypothetical protein